MHALVRVFNLSQLSGLEDALEYIELEEKFASQKSKDAAGQGKKKQPTVLDPRKAYNICELHTYSPTHTISLHY